MAKKQTQSTLQELNPFMPGAGMRPPELVGREKDLEIIDRMIARVKLHAMDRGIIFSGLRGVGKTVLLVACQELVERHGMTTARIEATGDADTDYDAMFGALSRAMIMSRHGSLFSSIQNKLANIESISLNFHGIGASIDTNTQDRPGTNPMRLELLIESIARQLQKKDSGLFLFIDEFQEMASEPLGTLISLQHRMGQDSLPFYIIGAGLPNLPGVLSRSKSYAERLFEYRIIGQLSEQDTAEGFQKPAARVGRPFQPDALEELVKVSQGYPYFIQAYGKAAWNASDSSPIALRAVKESEADARAELDEGLYASRWQRATVAGREYLAAMAAISGDEPSSTSDVARSLGKNTQQVSSIRQSLIELGLIYSPARGKVAFTVPNLGEFILRASPAAGQTYDGKRQPER